MVEVEQWGKGKAAHANGVHLKQEVHECVRVYQTVACDPRMYTRRRALSKLRQRLASNGLTGANALTVIASTCSLDDAHLLQYRFVFFALREDGEARLPREVAIRAWQVLLKGRMHRLSQWFTFLRVHRVPDITEDVWVQILRFADCLEHDLCAYDYNSAWPSLIDSFVSYLHLHNPKQLHIRSSTASSCTCSSSASTSTSTCCTSSCPPVDGGSKRTASERDGRTSIDLLADRLSSSVDVEHARPLPGAGNSKRPRLVPAGIC